MMDLSMARSIREVRLLVAALLTCSAGAGVVLAGPCTLVNLPPGWSCEDVGDTQPSTIREAIVTGDYLSEVFTVKAGGNANADFSRGSEGRLHDGGEPLVPGDPSDSFVFVYRPWSGGFEFTARLKSVTVSPGDAGIVGLMVRERVGGMRAPDARHVTVLKNLSSTTSPCVERYRRVQGEQTRYLGVTSVEPAHDWTRLRLLRQGDQVSLYCRAGSSSPGPWTLVGGTTLKGLAASIDVGLAVTVNNQDPSNSKWAQAMFDEVQVRKLWTTSSPTSWMANTLPGGGPRVPLQVSAMYVDSSGTQYTNRRYFGEEGWIFAMIDSTGQEVRRFDYASANGLWGGHAVTAVNSVVPGADFVYMAHTMVDNCEFYFPGHGACPRYPVRRYRKNGLPSPLPSGHGWDASMRVLPISGPVRGLATNQVHVYISVEAEDSIHVYDLDLQPVSPPAPPFEPLVYTIESPREIAVGSGYLWVIQATDPPAVTKLDPSTGVSLCSYSTSGWVPTAIAIHPTTGKAWVADDGENQNIKILNSDCTDSGSSFGLLNGIYGGATPGQVADTKFNGPVGVGFDSSGNVYIASNGPAASPIGSVPSGEEDGTGTELRSFTPAGTPRWEQKWLYGLEGEHAPDDDPEPQPTGWRDLFSATKRYQEGGQGWSYAGLTLDRFQYPHDGRLWSQSGFGGAMIRRLGPANERFMFLTGFHQAYLGIYRFESGSEIAIPAGLLMRTCVESPTVWPFNPTCVTARREIWTDDGPGNDGGDGQIDSNEWTDEIDTLNGRGVDSWYVDETGDIWATSIGDGGAFAILKYDLLSIDGDGVPRYQPASGFDRPDEFWGEGCTDSTCLVGRAIYVPSTNTMYLSGFTPNDNDCESPSSGMRNSNENEKAIGTVIYRYDNWGPGGGTLHDEWSICLPYSQSGSAWFNVVKSFEVVGNRIYVPITIPPEVRVYDAETAALIGTDTLIPGPEVAGKGGGLIASTSMQTIATDTDYVTRIATGELLGSKSLLYRVCTDAFDDTDMDGVDELCDTCPNTFNPTKLPVGNPSVTVTSPNGGQTFSIGSTKMLTWSASDTCGSVSDVDLLLSRTGVNGPTWEVIARGIQNTGSFVWTVTGPPTQTAFLKVVARDPAGNTGSDTSNAGFIIANP